MISFNPNNDLKATPVVFKISLINLTMLAITGVIGLTANGILDDNMHLDLGWPIAIFFGTATLGGYAFFRYIEFKYEPTWLVKALSSIQSPKTVKGVYLRDKILK